MAETIWTAEEQARLARPLNKWDRCPHCQQLAESHTFDPSQRELRCRPVETTSADDWLRTRQEERRAMRTLERAGEEFLIQTARPMARARREVAQAARRTRDDQPATADNKPRRYFDGE